MLEIIQLFAAFVAIASLAGMALGMAQLALGRVQEAWPKGDSLGRPVDFWALWEPQPEDTCPCGGSLAVASLGLHGDEGDCRYCLPMLHCFDCGDGFEGDCVNPW